jgi:hypothetical protein
MSTRCKSEFANRLANLNWNLNAVLALARYPRICSLALNAPRGYGAHWTLFGLDKCVVKDSFKLWKSETTNDYPHQAIQIPKDWNARLLFLSAEYYGEQAETQVSVVFENKKVNRFILERHPQVKNIPTASEDISIINYCPICGAGLLAPDKIDKEPLQWRFGNIE